ncbi:hypothetical protein D3C80_1667610 [compost metagenome]
MCNECIGVGAGIDLVTALLGVRICGNRLFDFRNQPFSLFSLYGNYLPRQIGIPESIRWIVVHPDRIAPADLVITIISGCVLFLCDDPGVAGKRAFKAARHGGEYINRRIFLVIGHW